MRQQNRFPLTFEKPYSDSALLVVADRIRSPDLPTFVPGLEEMEVVPSSSN